MAYLQNFTCVKCGKSTHMAIKSSDGWCSQCEQNQIDKEKRQYLAGLKGLTIKERIEKIELKLYKLTELVEKIDAATSIYTTRF